jgi:hypothetical protein
VTGNGRSTWPVNQSKVPKEQFLGPSTEVPNSNDNGVNVLSLQGFLIFSGSSCLEPIGPSTPTLLAGEIDAQPMTKPGLGET